MTEKSVSYTRRCGCRGADSKPLGTACPSLKKGDGTWNSRHGTWEGHAWISQGPDGTWLRLRRGGFGKREDAEGWFEAALKLLAIPEAGPSGHKDRAAIMDQIKATRKTGADLPPVEDIERRYAYGAGYKTLTVAQFLRRWLEAQERAGLKPTTLRGYKDHVNRVFIPVIGDVPLHSLTARHVDRVFVEVDKRNAELAAAKASPDPAVRKSVAGKRPASPNTMQIYRRTLRSAFGDAKRGGLLTVNWAKGEEIKIKAAKPSRLLVWTVSREKTWRARYEARVAELAAEAAKAWKPQYRRHQRAANPDAPPPASSAMRFRAWQALDLRPSQTMVWRPDTLGAFLDATADSRLYPMWYLAGLCGLRRGELCGLKWEHVDLAAGVLSIQENRTEAGGVVYQGTPKSDASEADVHLDADAVQVLTDWQLAHRAEADHWGGLWTNSGHVFTVEDGKAWNPEAITDAFQHQACRLGFPPISPHDLRHTAASLARLAGMDTKEIQHLLRHEDSHTTDKLYTALFEEMQKTAATAITAIVPRQKTGKEAEAC